MIHLQMRVPEMDEHKADVREIVARCAAAGFTISPREATLLWLRITADFTFTSWLRMTDVAELGLDVATVVRECCDEVDA